MVCSDADGSDCLHLAVAGGLTSVVETLCQRGAVLDARDSSAEPALWQALSAGDDDVADMLVLCRLFLTVSVAYVITHSPRQHEKVKEFQSGQRKLREKWKKILTEV